MTTLVVGGTGLLGSTVCDRLDDAVAVSRRTGFDFFDAESARTVDTLDPDCVVFAAAVERTGHERTQYEAAVRRFADACAGRRLVYLSSDSVFAGDAGRYGPDAERAPTTRYGRRLVTFEDAVGRIDDVVTLRPSYLYSGEPLDPRLAAAVEALRDGGSYRRFDDMYRSPAHVDDVASAVVELTVGRAAGVTGMLHVPGPRLSVYEFCRRSLSSLGVDVGGLVPSSMPPEIDVPRDCSLVDERFEAATGVEIRPPEASLDGTA